MQTEKWTSEDIALLERAAREYHEEVNKIEQSFRKGYPSSLADHKKRNRKAAQVWQEKFRDIYHLGFSLKDWSEALNECMELSYEDVNFTFARGPGGRGIPTISHQNGS